jgi:hypothetical protein
MRSRLTNVNLDQVITISELVERLAVWASTFVVQFDRV